MSHVTAQVQKVKSEEWGLVPLVDALGLRLGDLCKPVAIVDNQAGNTANLSECLFLPSDSNVARCQLHCRKRFPRVKNVKKGEIKNCTRTSQNDLSHPSAGPQKF